MHTCNYVKIRPYVNSKCEITKTSHLQIRFFFTLVYSKESEKEMIGLKKWGSLSTQRKMFSYKGMPAKNFHMI